MHSARKGAPRGLVATVVATVMALLVAACSTNAGGADTPAPGENGNEQVAADAPTEIRLALSAQPTTMDPNGIDAGESSWIWSAVFDTLLWADERGDVFPNAAESWEFSEDGLTLTLVLREGMTFSSGNPVTAADYVATVLRTRDGAGPRAAEVANFADVQAPDERTIVITLTERDPGLLRNLAGHIGVIADPAGFDGDMALDPIGSGAYVLDREATTHGATYVLRAREGYWNPDAQPFETVTFRVIADEQARLNALLAGELDASTVGAALVPQAEDAGFQITEAQGIALGWFLFFDRTEGTPLGDVRVRQAINMAFDRQLFVDAILAGGGMPTSSVFNPNGPAFTEELAGYWQYDPERAKELLAEAGYPDGFEIALPSTFLSAMVEPAVTSAFEAIGIAVTWDPVPPQEIAGVSTSGRWPAAFSFDGANAPAREAMAFFGPHGHGNPLGQVDPQMQALLDQIQTADGPELEDLFKEINRYAVENALHAPLFFTSQFTATAPGFAHVADGLMLNIRAFAPAAD